MASLASRFFTTLYSADAALSCFLKSESWRTVSPRYSVSTAVFAVPYRSVRASMLSTFAWVGTVTLLSLELVGDPLDVDLDTRPHRRGHGDRAQVLALGRRRFRPDDGLEQRQRIGRELLG